MAKREPSLVQPGRRVPSALSRTLRRLEDPVRIISNRARMLPSVLLIGSQKAGTTSLYRYLLSHPRVLAPARKEIGFFDIHYRRGLGWYKSRFPLKRPWPAFTLEASTGYFDYPHAPRHIYQTLPQARLILLVREPVGRAFSHYRHTLRMGHEPLSFVEAIASEDARLGSLLERVEADPDFYAREINYYSYLRRGRYAEHLERWYRYFPSDRLLVLRTEDLAQRPSELLETVWRFVGLSPHRPAHFERHNTSDGDENLTGETRARLEEYFAPYNRQLERLLGRSLGWSGAALVGRANTRD